MDSCKDTCGFHRWVSPFRNLRITACLRLPEAYRSLPRLSSALSAKASALRPSLLNLLYSPQNDKSFCMLHSHHKQSSVVVHDYNCLSIFRSTTYHCFGKQQSHFCSDEQNQSCCFDVCLFLYSVFKVPKTRCKQRVVRISIDIPNGDKEIRTLDPLLARQVLSQLSYVPISPAETYALRRKMGGRRLELPTSRLSGVRSNRLSYQPIYINAWHPPILPCSHPHSTVGRKGLNRRVRDGNGCYPFAHRHQANIAM